MLMNNLVHSINLAFFFLMHVFEQLSVFGDLAIFLVQSLLIFFHPPISLVAAKGAGRGFNTVESQWLNKLPPVYSVDIILHHCLFFP